MCPDNCVFILLFLITDERNLDGLPVISEAKETRYQRPFTSQQRRKKICHCIGLIMCPDICVLLCLITDKRNPEEAATSKVGDEEQKIEHKKNFS